MKSIARSRVLASSVALVLIVAGVLAGNWQNGKANNKEALRARLEQLSSAPPVRLTGAETNAAALDLHPVSVRGQWQPEFGIFLDNKMRQGVVGYEEMMPLRIEGSAVSVLVNRGWIAAGRDRSRLPQIRTASGSVEISGLARDTGQKFLELAPQDTADRRWQNVTIERFRDWSKLELLPVIVLQTSPADDGLLRLWDAPDLGIDKHRAYAFQWYALSAMTLALLIFFSFRRSGKI